MRISLGFVASGFAVFVAWIGTAQAGWIPLGNRWLAETPGQNDTSASAPIIHIYDQSFPVWGKLYLVGHLSLDIPDPNALGNAILARTNAKGRSRASDGMTRLRDMANRLVADRTIAFPRSLEPLASLASKGSEPGTIRLGNIHIPQAVQNSWLGPYLREIEYKKNPNGGYDIFWRPTQASASATAATASVLEVDVTNPERAFLQAMAWHGLETGVGELVGLIPELLTRAVVSTALDRLFHFIDLVQSNHQNMLLQMLADPAKMTRLQSSERSASIESMVFAQSSLYTGFEWIWKKPLEEWANLQSTEADNAGDSRLWLERNMTPPTDVGIRFAYTTDSDGNPARWYSLGANEPDPDTGPLLLLDLTQSFPSDIVTDRIAMEVLSTVICFGSTYIPWAGGVLDGLWEAEVEGKENDARVWEARLMATLENDASSGQSWAAELKGLSGQILNPLEVSWDGAP